MKQFAHLHLHTEFSLLDGATRTNRLFRRLAELDQSAVAITDHGNMFGAMTFYEAAKKFNKTSDFKVKPIIGCEVYTTPDMTVKTSENGRKPKPNHLILLCKNEEGYHNLIKMVSLGFTEGFYYKPRIDFPLLSQHSDGLICLSACIAGELPQAIIHALSLGDSTFAAAREIISRFKSLFGEDYYIEIQDHNLKAQKQILPHLVRLAGEMNVKIVATNDVHYVNKSDARMQKVLQCISFRDTLSESGTQGQTTTDDGEGVDDDAYFPTQEFYLKSYDEMLNVFPSYPEALSNTMEVAEKCGDPASYFERKMLTPEYATPDGSTPAEYLRKLTYEGISRLYPKVTDEIKARADYELGTIDRMGFNDYFLIVWDFIHHAENIGVSVGPGRGSGAGSIVAYAVGITKLDPLRYDLYFERFLNPERISNPDFDIDFDPEGRGKVISYVQNKYGNSNVAQIATFGTMAAKAAIKDVGRVLNVPFAEMNKITKLMPGLMGDKTIRHILGLEPVNKKDIDKAKELNANSPGSIEVPSAHYEKIEELVEIYQNDPTIRDVLDLAMQIEGMPRQTGLHAAGVIICKDEISMHAPLAMNSENLVFTQYNMIQCEALGLLKMDFLGLTNLTDINKTRILIEQTTGKKIDFYGIEYNDPDVYKMISNGDCMAVFQLENIGMTNFFKELRPDSIEDIIAGIALYRPGPMQYIPTFIKNKRSKGGIKYAHSVLEKNLSSTYGVMVYQEQVMNICRELAGYSLGEADLVRRAMSKKDKEKLRAEREKFVAGSVNSGMKKKDAEDLFSEMEHFAEYAFNKSHAAAYAYITYQTAYLKCHYPKEFMAAVLNNRINKIKEITKYLTYLKERKIKILPPDVNKSQVEFSVEGDGIRIGLAAIKGVGAAVMDEIVSERNLGGEYRDLPQLMRRIENNTPSAKNGSVLSKSILEKLILSGAFDCFGQNRSVLMQSHDLLLDRVKSDKKAKAFGQYSIFDLLGEDNPLDEFEYPNVAEFKAKDKLAYEKEATGIYLTGHPLEDYAGKLAGFTYNSQDFFEGNGENGAMELASDEEEESKSVRIKDGMIISLGGMVVSVEKRFSKQGKEFYTGKLEDMYGTIELLVTQNRWNGVRNAFAAGNIVTVTGRVAASGDRTPSVWVDKAEQWADKQEETTAKYHICCYLEHGQDNENYEKVLEVARAHIGTDKLYIKNTTDNKLYPSPIRVSATVCYPELAAVIGAKNVKITT